MSPSSTTPSNSPQKLERVSEELQEIIFYCASRLRAATTVTANAAIKGNPITPRLAALFEEALMTEFVSMQQYAVSPETF